MATANDDNFDIDIYGDGGGDFEDEGQVDEPAKIQADDIQVPVEEGAAKVESGETAPAGPEETQEAVTASEQAESQQISSTDNETGEAIDIPKQAPQTQGLKRKEGPDDRPTDPGATPALFVAELPWWITDDDIRGWANQCGCEDELEEITFSEHKVNGKSKGQLFILFSTPQASTAAKRKIESFNQDDQFKQAFTANFTNPYQNPFKTLPKDGNMRGTNQSNRAPSGGYNSGASVGSSQTGYSGGYRGGRGNYNRGAMQAMSGYNRGSYQQPPAQPVPGSYGGGYQPQMSNMQPYGGYQARGGMMGGMRGGAMGMRGGGRGGMATNMMGMPMTGMPMGGMGNPMAAMGMAMPQMGGAMGMQAAAFQNPGYYPQGPESAWNPHGAKRTRQE